MGRFKAEQRPQYRLGPEGLALKVFRFLGLREAPSAPAERQPARRSGCAERWRRALRLMANRSRRVNRGGRP
jgi:hypothetical protein